MSKSLQLVISWNFRSASHCLETSPCTSASVASSDVVMKLSERTPERACKKMRVYRFLISITFSRDRKHEGRRTEGGRCSGECEGSTRPSWSLEKVNWGVCRYFQASD